MGTNAASNHCRVLSKEFQIRLGDSPLGLAIKEEDPENDLVA